MDRKQHRDKLDKILQHTKFNHKTKALWAYYRNRRSAIAGPRLGFSPAEHLIMLNGSASYGLYQHNFKPETITHWTHAIKLIDIAAHQQIDIAARRHFSSTSIAVDPPYRRGFQ